MRIPMVSALFIAFVSACFPHPAAAQVIGQGQSVRNDEPTPEALAAAQRLRQIARNGGWWRMQLPSDQAAIESTLAAMKQEGASPSRLSEQLARAMMGLTDKDHSPPRPLVIIFADNLTRELLGKHTTNDQNTALRECISESVRATGTSNMRLASRLQQTLTTLGLKSSRTQAIINDLIKLRESVQGPDDISNKQLSR